MIIVPYTELPNSDLGIAVSAPNGKYEHGLLEYETYQWLPQSGYVELRGYDAQGAAVTVRVRISLLEEVFFGEPVVIT